MGSSINELEAALETLYHNTDPQSKLQANRWLEAWQQSSESWQGCHAVLQDDRAGLEAKYFAANTLRQKIQRDFEELPKDSVLPLAESVMNLLIKHAQDIPTVRTQLCIALAALATHVPAGHWGSGGPLAWWAAYLSRQPSNIALLCMRDLLTVLPQEVVGHQPALTHSRRRELHQEIEASIPEAFSLLSRCLSQSDDKARVETLEAFAAWLKLVGGEEFPRSSLIQSGSELIYASLDGLSKDGDEFYAATDVVIELIFCSSQHGRPRNDMAPLVQNLVPRVMSLRPRFHVCAQHAIAERQADSSKLDDKQIYGQGDPDEDAKAIARLFAEIGEAYTDLIATGASEVMTPVEALLDVLAHPDDDICNISLNFWHRLTRALTVGLEASNIFSEQNPAISKEESKRRIGIFRPYFERLVISLRTRVRYPDDFDEWHRDERIDFKNGRVAIGDTLLDATAVLGNNYAFQLLIDPLLELSSKIATGDVFDWRTAEAALYCIRCVYRAAPEAGQPLLLSLFSALPTLPSRPQLLYTTALTIGAYSDWLAETARVVPHGAKAINSLLEILIKGLSNEESCGACSLSIRRLCDGCAPFLASSMDSMLDLYQRVQPSGEIADEEESSLDLDEEDVTHIVEAVGLVASALPEIERRGCVQRLLDIVVQPMQSILKPWADKVNPTREDHARLRLVLPLAERITTIFKVVKDPADIGEALIRLLPWIEVALNAFGDDAVAAERLCRVPRYAIRSAGKATAGALPVLVQMLTVRFENYKHSSYLYVSSEMIKSFGDDTSTDNLLGPMLSRLLVSACSLLTTLRDVTARPDVADDTFLLAGRGLNYAPRLVIVPTLLPTLLSSVKAGILVQHAEACRSIVSFMIRLLDPATLRKCPQEAVSCLQNALLSKAPIIARLALAGALGALPRSRVQDMADVLHAMLKVVGPSTLEWIGQSLRTIPNEGIPPGEIQDYLRMCNEVASSGFGAEDERVFLEGLIDLSESCRRTRKSQEITQSALLPQSLEF